MKPYIPAIVCSFLACAAGADSGTYESEAFSVDTTLNLDVAPKSCNWQAGSITIKWTSVSSSVEEIPTYTVYWASNTNNFNDADFFDESKGNVHRLKEVRGSNTGSVELTYIDEEFCKQGDGTQIIYYCVKGSDGSRGCCATRRRFGLFVGFTSYENALIDRLPSSVPEANDVWNSYILAGGVESHGDVVCSWNPTCKILDDALLTAGGKVNTGDVFVFYVLTHGVPTLLGNFSGIQCYDDEYKCAELKKRLDDISVNAAVVIILGSCGSGQIAQKCGYGGNKAWITATRGRESASAYTGNGVYTGRESSDFGQAFYTWGWQRGLAAKQTVATYDDLANFAHEKVKGSHSGWIYTPWKFNKDILRNIVAYRDVARIEEPSLSSPSGFSVTMQDDRNLVIGFDCNDQASAYELQWTNASGQYAYWCHLNPIQGRIEFSLPNEHLPFFMPETGVVYKFKLAAINSSGLGSFSHELKATWPMSRLKTILINGVEWTYGLFDVGISYFKAKFSPVISAFTVGNVEIPREANGMGALSVGSYAFYGCNKITSVTVPDTVYSVGEHAFEGCDSLMTVTFNGELPDGLRESGLLSTSVKIRYPHKYAAQYAEIVPAEQFGGYSDAEEYEGATMSLDANGDFAPVDADGDGTYDQLVARAQITTDKGGDYNWSATLLGAEGEEIVISTGEFSLSAGQNPVSFEFDVNDILNAGAQSPFVVKDIILWNDDDFVQLTGELVSGEMLLESYDAAVVGVKAVSRWPFDGKIDIDCTVLTEDAGSKVFLWVEGYDRDLGEDMEAFSLTGDGVDDPVPAGDCRLTWDVVADYPDFHSSALEVKVRAEVVPGTSYRDVLENPPMKFSSGGDAVWKAWPSDECGDSVAESGPVSPGESSWLEAAVEGPGTMEFDWRVIRSDSSNTFEFLVDDMRWLRLGGKTGWQTESVSIPAGRHIVRWNYVRNSDEVGLRAKLDRVAWVKNPAGSSGTYMIVDLSGGANATNYPVSYIEGVPSSGWTDEYKTTKLVLRKIGPGSFVMNDSRYGRVTNELIQVTTNFYIGIFELTQRQWELVMGTRPSHFCNDQYYAMRPVEKISYDMVRGNSSGARWPSSAAVDAESFMGRLREKTNKIFDLPTEAQWEYACRAGTTTDFNNGQDLTSNVDDTPMNVLGRYYYNGGEGYDAMLSPTGGTALVGSYAPNAWGLYDMHGNVFELCLDWYQTPIPFGANPVSDPKGPSNGEKRIVRGGARTNAAAGCESTAWSVSLPSEVNSLIGCRLCCAAAGVPSEVVGVAAPRNVRAALDEAATTRNRTYWTVTWDAVEGAEEYLIYKASADQPEQAQLLGSTTDLTYTFFADNSPVSHAHFSAYYFVKAVRGTDESDFSDSAYLELIL